MNDQYNELLFSKMDDIQDMVKACHMDIRALAIKLEEHIEEDRLLANEVWFMKRAVQTTWGVVVTGIGIVLAWMGLSRN